MDRGPQASRVWLECTSTRSSRYNTGIQRAGRNLVNASLSVARPWSCTAVFYNGRFLEAIDSLPEAATGAGRSGIDVLRQSFHNARALSLRVAPAAHAAVHSQRLEYRLRRFVYGIQNARRWVHSLTVPQARRVQFRRGDVLVLLDPTWSVDLSRELKRAKDEGVKIWMVVNDLIPIEYPELAPEGTPILMDRWLRQVVPVAHGALGISRSVAIDLRAHLKGIGLGGHLRIDHFYLGAGLGEIDPSVSQVAAVTDIFAGGSRVYLIVGTIEPRKNHAMVIDTFDRLWASGSRAKLMIFGRLGWRSDDLARRIQRHPELGRRLLWLEAGTNSELDFAYRHATALLFPSRCEGFGLPLVEAMLYGLPVLASDIPVFREIGGDYPRFFDADADGALEQAIRQLEPGSGPTVRVRCTPRAWLSWHESAQMLLQKVTGG
jgi:glycosyltransferase involved in cell wall biosynthesis